VGVVEMEECGQSQLHIVTVAAALTVLPFAFSPVPGIEIALSLVPGVLRLRHVR
jgi:hypothetical protein